MVGQSSNLLRFNLGGWSLSEYHNFDSTTKTVFTGFGPRLLLENPAVTPAYLANAANIINVPSADSTRIYQFSPAGLHLRTLDALTAVAIYSFQHDASNRLISIRDRDGLETLVQRDSGGKVLAIVGPYGDKTTLSLDASGYLASITNPQNERTSFSYFAAPKTGLMASYTDPLGSQKSYTFDAKGQLSEAKDFNGGIKKFTTNRSDPGIPLVLGSIFSSPMGRLTQYLSSPGGDGSEKLENIYPDDRGTENFTYTKADQTMTHTSFSGRKLTMNLDSFGRITKSQFGNLAARSYSYDTKGRLIKQTQASRSISYTYDAKGLLASVTDPLGRITKFGYDLARRLKSITLPNAKQILMGYDAKGRDSSVTLPGAQSYSQGFDKKDNLLSLLEPIIAGSSYQWNWQYNLDDDLIKETLPDTSLLNLSYDDFGRLKGITGPNITRTISYDGYGSIGAIKSSSSDQVEFIRYGSWIDSIVWTGKTKGKLGFTPIAPGRLAGISINDQPQISYEYTPDGEVAKANDLVIGRGSITGLISSTNLQTIETKFTYNTFAEPTAYSAKVGTDTLVSFTYTRDALGRIVSMAKTEAGQSSTKTFSYDTIGQLTGETSNGTATGTYSYDANGNRSTTGGGQVYDAHDRLTSDAVWTYTYNRSGYLIKKQHKINGSYVGYTYDNLGNLLK
ncbi:MAG: hypothetical protein NTX25_10875, partial [Proteobacteria bacterium]|nr:hypothetical protein [Pseudomonadota bacterium]